MRKLRVTQVVLAAVCLAADLIAQGATPGSEQQGRPPGPPIGPLKVHKIGQSVYWASGGVGNVGFIVGDKGVTVIDTTFAVFSAQELLADIARVTAKPVTAVILTHGDVDHVGGLGAFPAGIAIYAQENNKARMESGIAAGRSRVPADHLPNHTVTSREALTLNGDRVELLHWAPAHTDGDLVVFLPAQKIVFTGDIFALDQPRALIHQEQKGTSAGWITSAKGIIALNANQFVVGHGNVQTKKSLEDRIALVTAERDEIKKMVAEGKTLPEIQGAVGDPPLGQSAGGPGGPHFTAFSQVVYQELTSKN